MGARVRPGRAYRERQFKLLPYPESTLLQGGVEIEGPSTLCLARIEGPVKSPLTTTEDHRGQPEEAYGDSGLNSPFFTARRIGDVAQPCQYEKPPFWSIKKAEPL
jgi:hypothetical protein